MPAPKLTVKVIIKIICFFFLYILKYLGDGSIKYQTTIWTHSEEFSVVWLEWRQVINRCGISARVNPRERGRWAVDALTNRCKHWGAAELYDATRPRCLFSLAQDFLVLWPFSPCDTTVNALTFIYILNAYTVHHASVHHKMCQSAIIYQFTFV